MSDELEERIKELGIFLRLGFTSFGGPIAHLGYFRTELVERRQWCSEETYAEIIAVSRSLPGPASSQTAFSLGLLRGGWLGGLVAWVGFTFPSAALMLWFAFAEQSLHGKMGAAVVHGLQLSAVAVVAQAILVMRKRLTPDWQRVLVALVAVVIAMFGPASISTFLAIVVGALCGAVFLRGDFAPQLPPLDFRISRRAGAISRGFLPGAAHRQRDHPENTSWHGAGEQRFLPQRGAGVWRWPCGLAAARTCGRIARLGNATIVPDRLRFRASASGPTVRVCGFSRCGDPTH
jgi:chromate transport protein ChrA